MDKTYVFDNADGGCSNNGMMGLIASLCNQRGLDPNLVAALMNNNRGYGDGFGNSAWWIIILLIFGWGGFGGFGGGFNGRGSAQGLADLGNLVNNDAGRDLIMQAIQGNATAISQLASTVHCDQNALMGAVQNLSTQLCNLGLGQKDLQFAVQNGQQAILSKLCDCCCDIKTLVTNQGYENRITTINQTNDIVQNATSNTNVLAAKIDAQTQMINDRFCQLEMREMQRENQNLRDQVQAYQLSASQQNQTANIVSQLQPVPRPAYLVGNPYGCACNNFGYPFYGYNGGGCCNNNNCGGGCGCC